MASTMESAAVEACTVMKPARVSVPGFMTADETVHRRTPVNRSWPINPTRPIGISRTHVPPVRMAPTAEPWAGSYEDPAHEVVRTPIPGWRADVRIIRIIAPRTNRFRSDRHSYGPHTNAYRNLRGTRATCGQK